jgi:hypothetical protein
MPGLRPRHQPASVDVLTHNARPHFAKIRLICVRPHGRATQKPAARNRQGGCYAFPRVAYLYVTQCGQRCPRVEVGGWPALRLAATGADRASGT